MLSIITHAPRSWTAAAMAGMSCTSKVSEPGDSVNTTVVLVAHERGDIAPDQGVVVRGLDAEAGEHRVAESPGRAIDRVGDEHVVAHFHEREQGGGDGG